MGGLLYLLATDGTMIVAQAGTEYREQARSKLGNTCRASPAFADGRIYIRGLENLYCIGKKTEDREQRTEDRKQRIDSDF